MRRDLTTFSRWAALALGRTGPAPTPAAIESAWRAAQRTISGRLALACARERLVPASLRGSELSLDGIGELPLRRRSALELHTPATDDLPSIFTNVRELWTLVGPSMNLEPPTYARILTELEDSAFNLALAYLVLARRPTSTEPVRDLENLVIEGHPWHPMCKTRLGLGLRENLLYAPEHLALAPVAAVDIREELVRRSGEYDRASTALFGHARPGWIRVPVHGLQLRRLPALFPDRFGRHIVPADVPPKRARALLSLRTVAIDEHSCHLKLAVDVLTTSVRRAVSPMSVFNGPRVSALLESIQRTDPIARGVLEILPERAAAGLEPTKVGPGASQLGVIMREPSHEAWVCAALAEPWPGGEPCALERLCAGYPGTIRERASAMVSDYVDLLVPPLVRLVAAHGIALEAHLQNMLVRERDGRPIGFAIRDLGGIRIHESRLRAAGHDLELDPDSFIVTSDLAEVQSKLMHTLFHAHLATVFRWLEDLAGLPESQAWSLARSCVVRCLETWQLGPAGAEDRAVYLAPTCRAKALFAMRILDRSSEYAYVDLDNPLAPDATTTP